MPLRNTPSVGPITVVQMAERLGLSRRRFYELVESGKFPPPAYRLDNRKPFYPPGLQERCLLIRNTGEAFDGSLLLFNRPRVSHGAALPARRRMITAPTASRPQEHSDLMGYLAEAGLTATVDQVSAAMAACFPGGTEGIEQGQVWRDVFRHLRAVNRT